MTNLEQNTLSARQHIAEALTHIELADALLNTEPTAPLKTVSAELDIGPPPHNLLDLALGLIAHIEPETLRHQAFLNNTSERDFLYRVYTYSCQPREIREPLTTILVMLAATLHGMSHPLIVEAEQTLGIAPKTPALNHAAFVETFTAKLANSLPHGNELRDWIQTHLVAHYPHFRNNNQLDLPDGRHIVIPKDLAPIQHQKPAPVHVAALLSPVDHNSATIIPSGSSWRITLGYGSILNNQDYPDFHMKHHSGLDVAAYNCYGKPVFAMYAGLVISALNIPDGFGNTLVIEEGDGKLIRYAHLHESFVTRGDMIRRGQRIGSIGRGANNVYAAHLHMDMPRDSNHILAGTYYSQLAELNKRFINPLTRIPARP